MKKFYFTFGSGQEHEGCYHVIEAENWGEAREFMVNKFGTKWAFQYTEEEWVINSHDYSYSDWMHLCRIHHVSPEITQITQAEMYNLKRI